jgi:hypothetical protein
MFLEILGHIFYFIGLFILIMSFSDMFNFLKYISIKNWSDSFKKVTGKDPKKSEFRSIEDYNIFSIYVTFTFVEFIWILIGLTSSSWYIFLSLLITELFYRFYISVTSLTLFVNKIIGQIFYCLKFIIILLLILNHFHFHINWINLFR